MTTYLSIIRPAQWVKNLFVFLPVFFGRKLLCAGCMEASAWGFAAFCLISSAIYCLNDIRDIEADRQHPVKCRRPLASGRMPVSHAWWLLALLLAGVTSIALLRFRSDPAAIAILAAYFVINVLYCYWLKQLAIVDVFVIAFGFVLRLMLGGAVCDIWLSPWIVCMTFLLSLFLAFAKRRDDVIILEEKGTLSRKSIARYNIAFMNQTLGLLGAITMVCYIIYSVSPEVEERIGSGYVYVSSVFVLAGILRYLQLTMVDRRSGSPTRVLLTDRFIQLCMAGWILFFVAVLYF